MELVLTSILVFASTNIDDIFILMLFFANREYKARDVFIGQYLGIIALIVVSVIGSLVGLFLDGKYIGLLGFLPIYFGIRGIVKLFSNGKHEPEKTDLNTSKSNKMLSVATVTFANGGDNIGIYIPLFATLTISQKTLMITIFILMVAVWCFAAKYLGRHPLVAKSIDKYGHIVTPIVFILLGIYILYESGTLKLF